MSWLEASDLEPYLKAHLTISNSAGLQDHWTPILEQALVNAYGYIRRSLVGRGYTQAQVDAWDDGKEYQQDLAMFLTLKRIGAVNPADTGALDALDRRPELTGDANKGIQPVALTINGVFQDPQTKVGQVTQGPMDTTEDLFFLDPEDSRLGEVTRF